MAQSGNGTETPKRTRSDIAKEHSTAGDGATLRAMFPVAANSFTVGVSTFAAVPVLRKLRIDDVTDQMLFQLEYILAGQAVSGTEDFSDAYHAADKAPSTPLRTTELEDAADDIVVRLLTAQGITQTKRADRVPYVNAMLDSNDPATITKGKVALSKQLASNINANKAKKGSTTATPTAKVSVTDLFASMS